ncbi:MAG: chorismate mutase [Clostridiales bacterium]
MKVLAVRGATTVNNNDSVEIIDETKKLLSDIIEKNSIDLEDIISVIFTMTDDLNDSFPAIAARQIGWKDIPLMCMKELNVKDSLEKCIRVMFYINSEKERKDVKHIYLNKSKILRPDLEETKK